MGIKHENILNKLASPITLKKSLKVIQRKFIISNYYKIEYLLNVSKAWQAIVVDSLKNWEPSTKPTKTNLFQKQKLLYTTASFALESNQEGATT